MKIGLFFGTFNPIHLGHVHVGLSLFKAQPVEQLWFVITPMSPFKKDQQIISKEHRLNMVSLALEKYNNLLPSALEFELNSPNYTCDTLRYIKLKFPHHQFVILMGSDNYLGISKWKEHQYILDNFQICVYDRGEHRPSADKNMIYIEGEYINISSSQIRNDITSPATHELLNCKVSEYIRLYSLYNK